MVHRSVRMKQNRVWILICLVVLFPWTNGSGQVNPDNVKKVEWLKKHAIRLNSIDPEDVAFSDLKPVKKMIGNARVVMLGEQSHGDGATFHAKIRLIRFLHQECGFDVLAFESGLYDCKKGWDQILTGTPVKEAVNNSVFSIWTKSEAFAPLIRYVDAAKSETHPLEMAGFDCQFTSSNSRNFLISDLKAFLQSEEMDTAQIDGWPEFSTMLAGFISNKYRQKAPEASEEEQFLNTIDRIRAGLSPEPSRAREFWRQLLKSIRSEAQSMIRMVKAGAGTLNIRDQEFRDMQMGENIAWLADVYYPTRKIIVWAASMHNAYMLREVDTRTDRFSYQDFNNMGFVVHEKLGDAAYNLGFTAYEGSFGPWMYPGRPLEKPSPESLEALFEQTGFDQFIVDFKKIPSGGEWLRDPWTARPFGYSQMIASWPRVFDGICFTKTMFPSEPIEDVPGQGTCLQYVDAASYRGREILFRLQMKAEMSDNSGGNIWLRVDLEPGKTGLFKNLSEPVTQNEWKVYEVQGKVDEEGQKICVGFLFSGDGRLWVDDCALFFKDDAGELQPVSLENPGFETSTNPNTPDSLPGWRVSHRPGSMTFNVIDVSAVEGDKCLLIEFVRKKKGE